MYKSSDFEEYLGREWQMPILAINQTIISILRVLMYTLGNHQGLKVLWMQLVAISACDQTLGRAQSTNLEAIRLGARMAEWLSPLNFPRKD